MLLLFVFFPIHLLAVGADERFLLVVRKVSGSVMLEPRRHLASSSQCTSNSFLSTVASAGLTSWLRVLPLRPQLFLRFFFLCVTLVRCPVGGRCDLEVG